MSKEFKVGDRVRVYATLNGVQAEDGGAVTQIRNDKTLCVKLDGTWREIFAHPKQCRRLMKRKAKSVWIRTDKIGDESDWGANDITFDLQEQFRIRLHSEFTEFREVIQKKNK